MRRKRGVVGRACHANTFVCAYADGQHGSSPKQLPHANAADGFASDRIAQPGTQPKSNLEAQSHPNRPDPAANQHGRSHGCLPQPGW